MSENATLFKERLTKFADSLLDLTARNRMIHSNFQAKTKLHFRFIDEVANQLYQKLSTSSMQFKPLPEPDEIPLDESSTQFKTAMEVAMLSDEDYLQTIDGIEDSQSDEINQDAEAALRVLKNKVRESLGLVQLSDDRFSVSHHAEQHGLNPSYDLPRSNQETLDEPNHQDKNIQTLMLSENLQRHIKSIYTNYKSSIRESGVNPLYVCFGFLEWKESSSSDKTLYSPLLMLPVIMDDEKRSSTLDIKSTGDEILINQTLSERLKRDFKLELPSISDIYAEDEEDEELDEEARVFDVEKYIDLVEELIAEPKGWKVRNWASFGIYQAQNMPIYADIKKLLENNTSELLDKIISGLSKSEGSSAEVYDVDDDKVVREVPALVEPADASQYSAVIDVIKGQNLVIKGPPGTGKSQTITNIIAALMMKGKKVLFVAQKQAALDVVRNNLAAAGLENYLLEIFSIKGKKKTVLESIGRRVNQETETSPQDYFQKIEALQDTKKKLNHHAGILGEIFGGTGKTIHDLLWDKPSLDFKPPNSLKFKNKKKILKIAETQLDLDISNLKYIQSTFNDVYKTHSFDELAITQFKKFLSSPFDLTAAKEELDSLNNLISPIHDEIVTNLELSPYLADHAMEEILNHSVIKEFVSNNGPEGSSWQLIRMLLHADIGKLLIDYIISFNHQKDLTDEHESDKEFVALHFDNSDDLYDLKDLKKAIITLEGSHFFSIFFSEWRQAHRLFKSIYVKPDSHSGKEEAILLKRYLSFEKNSSKNLNEISSLDSKNKKLESDFKAIFDDINFNQLQETGTDACETLYKKIDKLSSNFQKLWLDDPKIVVSHFHALQEFEKTKQPIASFFENYDIDKGDDFLNNAQIILDMQTSPVTLDDHMKWLATEKNIDNKQLRDFYNEYIEEQQDINLIDKVYKYFIRTAQQELIYDKYPELGSMGSDYIEKLRDDLRSLDKQIIKLSKKLVGYETEKLGSKAPKGSTSGKVSEKTGMALIDHVAQVPNARTTIREFFKRAADAATFIKPCTLMSPLAVSQTLPLTEMYDVVIIDEASQMKPEYSICSIARAKQAVIVGDQNQLPPTTVFQRMLSEDENDEDTLGESILDMALTVLPNPRELLYHYRSRHEDLIKFSNAEFYNNLMIPVTAHTHDPNKGIKHIFLEEARYKTGSQGQAGGINPIEAEKVVQEVLRLMKERPHESIGVATMNQKQKELVENRLQLEAAKNREALKYISYWEEKDGGLNYFFVKNLENVQGDERDTIVISTVYGPNQEGTRAMPQRFGDIGKQHGWRRLNVLFTRAKNQIILVTSMTPADILEEGKSEGVQVLKKYIAFAETKILQVGDAGVAEIESPFQAWGIDQVNSLPGFSAEWEIGASGYRIDIGVKHEDYPYGYILGVETDGATYHSTKAARDRDYLRQEVLEGYGWHFHRIWSTDWMSDPVGTKEKLHQKMKSRLETCLKEVAELKEKNQSSDDESPLSLEVVPDTFDAEYASQSIPYPEADISDYIDVNPEQFYNRSYRSQLQNAIQGIIEVEEPISHSMLVERIRKAHSLARGGTQVRSTITSAIPIDIQKTSYEDEVYYWAQDTDIEHYNEVRHPSSGARDISDVAPEEILAISKYLKDQHSPTPVPDIVKAISEFLGHQALRGVTRELLKHKLWAAGTE